MRKTRRNHTRTVGGVKLTAGTSTQEKGEGIGINRRLINAACNCWEIARGNSPQGMRGAIKSDVQEKRRRKCDDSDDMTP